MKKIVLAILSLFVLSVMGVIFLVTSVNNGLPEVLTLKDYKPLLVTNVYAKDGRKIGEFFRERRVLVPFERIPKVVVNAFLAAEDADFYQHKGINYQAIMRAMLVNIKAGHTVQGGSTITQQVAKTLMLSSERTITRKIKDALLALKMEKSLSKEDILFLYLNQIYLGQSSYGISVAAETYFRKSVEKINLGEAALLAGLPQAPSRYSPVLNPKRAKERQRYVLKQMVEKNFVTADQAEAAMKSPIKVFIKEKYEEMAPFYLETVRQMLVKKLTEEVVLDQGLKVYTGLDFDKQIEAQKSVEKGLRDLDKRQGFRGPIKNISQNEISKFLEDETKALKEETSSARMIDENGEMSIVPEVEGLSAAATTKKQGSEGIGESKPLDWIKVGSIMKGVVTNVDDQLGLVSVQAPGGTGLIDLESMKWARKPNPDIAPEKEFITQPSQALKVGDIVELKLVSLQFQSERLEALSKVTISKGKGKVSQPAIVLPSFKNLWLFELEQEPQAEGALLSLDLETDEVIAMVGGRSFEKSEFNRTIQAARQTGSSFKSIIYAAALDKGYTPATPILDAPVVFEEEVSSEDTEGQESPRQGKKKNSASALEESKQTKTWKPTNHSKTFEGDILFRNALVKSLNVPTVRIIEDIGVNWSLDYAQRLGIFSPLNKDFTLALGSSSVTLYEMTKVFGHFGRLGKRMRPMMIRKVINREGKELVHDISIEEKFSDSISALDESFEKKRKEYLELRSQIVEDSDNEELMKKLSKWPALFFENQDQLIDPTTAYLITTLLKATIEEPGGTGARARSLGREVAGKTGTTNGYYDAWFIGYTPNISTGVWVGFDQEKTLGVGEVGGRVALPIWVDYMKAAHSSIPESSFVIPSGIVFASIDNATGKLPSASSKNVVRQAFREGTEPTSESSQKDEETDFYKQDLEE